MQHRAAKTVLQADLESDEETRRVFMLLHDVLLFDFTTLSPTT